MTQENKKGHFSHVFRFIVGIFVFIRISIGVVLQPSEREKREREEGFQSGSGCLPTPCPSLSPPPTLAVLCCRCSQHPKAVSLFTSLPTTPHRAHHLLASPLHFLATYPSQSPRLLLDCSPHSPEPPPCRGSTARGSPLRETSPLRLEATQMLIGRAAQGFLLCFVRQLLMPRLLLCPPFSCLAQSMTL